MANNSMGTKKVEELLVSKSMPLGMQFYVPNYQRGYRWKESQVQQLLNDIKEFDYEKNNEKKFYCLQPLVVTEDKENGWVVIDGQQRLTTLFIILTCIEKMLYKEKAQLYQMNYQNKPQIEHIHSVTTERAQNKKEREEWLDSAWPYIESVASDPKVFEMYTKAKDVRDNKFYDDEHATEYDEMYNSVIAFFSGETGIDNKPINEISNLTLLDQRTNRGYRNHIFPVKRNKILEKSGVESFIPLCTKNVFLKFYSKTVSQMYLWDKNDRKDYFDKMADEIFYYLSGTRKEQ